MIIYQSPVSAGSRSVISGASAGDTHGFGFHDPAYAMRRQMRGSPGGPLPMGKATTQVLPEQAIGTPRPEPQQREGPTDAFLHGAASSRPGGDAPAVEKAAEGAVSGAAERGGIARAAAGALRMAATALV